MGASNQTPVGTVNAVFAIPGDIATPTGGYKYDREVLARLAAHGVGCRHLVLPAGFPFPSGEALRATSATLADVPPGMPLLIDGLAFGALPIDMVRAIRAPIVALVHHPLGFEAGLPPATATEFVVRESAALAMARSIVVTSPTTARLLATDLGVRADRITVAEPGTERAARAVGSADSVPHLLAVGAISRRKGYDVLVAALVRLRDRPWRMTIAGADDRAPEVAAEIRGLIEGAGLGDRIRMLGTIEPATLDRLYASADVFLMPSLYEGYGMVLAEAMIRGLPIVCTTGGAAAETVPDAAALKVPPGDADAFADATRRLLDEPDRRATLAEASWAAGLALPTWDDTARIIARVLEEARP